jgi:hypothetical protein
MTEDGITQCKICGRDFILEDETEDICADCKEELGRCEVIPKAD